MLYVKLFFLFVSSHLLANVCTNKVYITKYFGELQKGDPRLKMEVVTNTSMINTFNQSVLSVKFGNSYQKDNIIYYKTYWTSNKTRRYLFDFSEKQFNLLHSLKEPKENFDNYKIIYLSLNKEQQIQLEFKTYVLSLDMVYSYFNFHEDYIDKETGKVRTLYKFRTRNRYKPEVIDAYLLVKKSCPYIKKKIEEDVINKKNYFNKKQKNKIFLDMQGKVIEIAREMAGGILPANPTFYVEAFAPTIDKR